ncbi:recombinase RmuC [Hahella sp. CCB-MM4]|uniref:DNA recombination protein RmuC n=1 Tax=Hahella sp. (strain CCB-MM4) TaxID=1926491 RepID=UPI000B9B2CA9|nr:DNA recombination protein RmuC [Hahella sp. CCB-MM4]OZG72071.1 recombinase RmuC [Hahella sp. CCB-MM4]
MIRLPVNEMEWGIVGLTTLLALLCLTGLMLRRSLTSEKKQSDELRQAIRSKEDEMQQLVAKVAEKEARLENLQDDFHQLRQEYVILKTRAEDRQSQLIAMEQRLDSQQQEAQELLQELNAGKTELASLQTARDKDALHHAEKIRLLEESREKLTQEFQLLANRIFEANTRKLSEHSETQIKQVLNPIQDQLKDFRQKIEDVYEKESQQRFSLANEVKKLQTLNERISEDAIALTNALKGENKTAGNWGEVVLERILERSGLNKGQEYDVQVSQTGADGRRQQPDVVVRLPDNKSVIIDSKVSLLAYEQFHNAENDEDRATAIKQHLASIRQHVKNLSSKNYQEAIGIQSLDFVLLFVPIEGAFAAAVQQDSNLFAEAFELNVVIVSPSTLLATLRTIHNIWRYEYQSQNALEIARQAGNLYDKFVNFTQDLESIGQRLEQTQKAYDSAMGRLSTGRGNLVARVERLKQLGARASKQLPESLTSQEALQEIEEEDSL